jgi:hypothetical protein
MTLFTLGSRALFGALVATVPLLAFAYDLPDPKITPGAINETVTQANIRATICKKGWTRTIRPPVSYTNRLKHQLMRKYGVAGESLKAYELDHLLCRVGDLLRTEEDRMVPCSAAARNNLRVA